MDVNIILIKRALTPNFMNILIVEDEQRIARFIKKGLELEEYLADVSNDGAKALEMIQINGYDLIILDIMLPGLSGIEICQKIRQDNIDTPVIILTARDSVEDRVSGLDAGADDYLVKPFAIGELLARIRALLRREKTTRQTVLRVSDLTLNPSSHVVTRGERELELTSKEYKILDYLMRRPDQVCTRTMIMEHVWGYDYAGQGNIVDVYITYLRKKIDKGYSKKLIQTIRDVGYKIRTV